jgi:hypothetical protein
MKRKNELIIKPKQKKNYFFNIATYFTFNTYLKFFKIPFNELFHYMLKTVFNLMPLYNKMFNQFKFLNFLFFKFVKNFQVSQFFYYFNKRFSDLFLKQTLLKNKASLLSLKKSGLFYYCSQLSKSSVASSEAAAFNFLFTDNYLTTTKESSFYF